MGGNITMAYARHDMTYFEAIHFFSCFL